MTGHPPRSTLFPSTTLFRSGGDVAALDDRVLHALHHDVHARRTQAAPGGGIAAGIGCRQRPAEARSEEHTSELQSQSNLVCRLLLEKKKNHSQPVHVDT